jgi:hypothetical protein
VVYDPRVMIIQGCYLRPFFWFVPAACSKRGFRDRR